ncbi:leucine-rich repeat and IQ domain-containing protein 1 isoform X2 [Rhinatrema bivittatum]|uniref:leucine-rich repeat and IQ domain-containing protein 1 isoform X2 n=1 Tax=Rhinatrema bivittatum TaxID=194408 RepID=UPI00112BDCD6|nr:leucine-rich repeat and IQ domain-containing protein 1 isoform X2 [Rhinatrema bivittatum]
MPTAYCAQRSTYAMDGDLGLEAEIELELGKVSVNSLEGEDAESEVEEESWSTAEEVPDELPESILCCLQLIKNRTEHVEKFILQDLNDTETWLSDCYTKDYKHNTDFLNELAAENNEDPETFKKRILAEIEQQDKEDQEIRLAPDGDVKNFHRDDPVRAVFEQSTSERGGFTLSLDCLEVEELCLQKLQLWEEKQKKLDDEERAKLKIKKEKQEKQNQEEEERRRIWHTEFESEKKRLELIHLQQQASLEEEMKKNQECFEKELKEHKELIKRLQLTMQEERKVYEEEKRREKEALEEQRCRAATKIQAKFRSFLVFRKYAPILKKRLEEVKRKKELQQKLERERKEMQEKIRRKLEEKQQREKEKKLKDEQERKIRAEIERQELLEQEKRRAEYEKKKEEERQRLEREKQCKLLELKMQKEEMERKLQEEKRKKATPVLEKEKEIVYLKKAGDEKGTVNKELQMHDGKKRAEEMNEPIIQNEGKQIDIIKQKEGLEIEKEEETICAQTSNIEMNPSAMENENGKQKGSELTPKISLQNLAIDIKSKDHSLKSSEMTTILVSDDQMPKRKEGIPSSCDIVSCQQSNMDIMGPTIQSLKPESLQEKSKNEVLLSVSQANADFSVKKNQEEMSKNWEGGEDTYQLSERHLILPDHIETKRLAWMKTCNPWSKISKEHQRKKVVNRSKPRTSSAANRMPPISAEIILQTDHWSALQQVTTVTLQDLPGCSLSTLLECTRLQSLSLKRCGLTTLEGLGNCKELKYIDVQENNIQTVNCEDLENLCILLLGNNQLSSIHGLDGCSNLRNLQLSYNKITRIGGLESLKHLQQLVVDHNQLITTKGLEDTPTLMYLDCSYNHLSELKGIRNCGLLQILKLQGNNLSEPPNLENQVLLRELHLDDNSVSTLETMSSFWLPLLQVLSISQNSLTQLAPLFAFVSLEKVDLSNNRLSDLKNALTYFDGCQNLNELSLIGNPLLQEIDWRCSLCKILPTLKILNGESLNSEERHPNERIQKTLAGHFLASCQAQIKELDLLLKRRNSELKTARSLVHASQIHCLYFAALMKLGNEHRYAHEYGDLSVNERDEPEAQRDDLKPASTDSLQHNNLFITGANENKQNTSERQITSGQMQSVLINSCIDPTEKNQEYRKDKMGVKCNISHNRETENNTELMPLQKTRCIAANSASSGEQNYQFAESNSENFAAIVIQSHWRGYIVRRDIHFYAKLHEAATVIQAAWRNHCITRKKISPMGKAKNPYLDNLESKEKAAVLIQAVWKGFLLRQKLASAFAEVEKDRFEEELEEVNLEDFTFDEAALEKDWLPLDSARFPSKTSLLANQLQRPKDPEQVLTSDVHTRSLPWHPRPAWQYNEIAETENVLPFEKSKPNSWSEKRTLSRLSDMKPISESLLKSEKEEQISEEWGFKDISTAQLMLKRAQKMKSKTTKKKKLLDPAVRLALFKTNENKHPPLKPSKKKEPERVEYFQAREEEFARIDSAQERKLERSRELTYQWLHTQVGDYETSNSRVMKCRFLPELDPEVLNGGRVQLVTSLIGKEAMDLDLVSMTSGGSLTQGREKNETHKQSAGSSNKDMPAAMKTNSRAWQKERISFRDHPVQLSGGWGSGKKRAKSFK